MPTPFDTLETWENHLTELKSLEPSIQRDEAIKCAEENDRAKGTTLTGCFTVPQVDSPFERGPTTGLRAKSLLMFGIFKVFHCSTLVKGSCADNIARAREPLGAAKPEGHPPTAVDPSKQACPCCGTRIIEVFECGATPRHWPTGLTTSSGSTPHDRVTLAY
jgi:hypothetical protein